jgi:glutaredoxin
MRRFLTSKPVKFVGFTTVVAVGGLAAFGSAWGGRKSYNPTYRPLAGTEFNALQDAAALQASLAKLPLLERSDEVVTLFAMRGCPFCARVRSILTYYGVPFEEVIVDPLLGSELAEHPYKSLPQVQFRRRHPATGKGVATVVAPSQPLSEEERKALLARPPARADFAALLGDGPFVVESDSIVRKLSVPLGFAAQLESTDISVPRETIANEFQRYVYVSAHATWARATQAMVTETDPKFHIFPVNRIGGFFLWQLATRKVLGRALATTKLTFPPDATPAQKADKMLREYLSDFVTENKRTAADFASAAARPKFNLLDVEMHGVLSQVRTLPHVAELIAGAGAQTWLEKIDEAVRAHEGKASVVAQLANK